MDESVIFAKAIKLTGMEREAWLNEACGKDEALRARMVMLLEAHDDPRSELESPLVGDELRPGDQETVLLELERHGKQIGPYKLLELIGEGGMGMVFMAEQKEPVKRRVALKIVKPGMDSREVIARFEAERQALAMMDHPNIAKVLDAGQTAEGRPYFVMEFVNGLPITEFCDQHQLSTAERIELFVEACRGVQHAHHKGVIHRDLKPGNILVAQYDEDAVVKVIDFGVAKATNQQLTEKTLFTKFGQLVGTLEYMSPEQAKRNQLDVDTRSDVYSLGIVLYELLTGETPVDQERLREIALDEMLRIIRDEEAPLPSLKVSSSARLEAVAAKRSVDPRRLTSLVRGDLDWIALKALEKNRSSRYASPQEFADDLVRHLTDRPIVAGPPRFLVKCRKFAKRHAGMLGAAAVVLCVIAIGTGWWYRQTQAEIREVNDRTFKLTEAIDVAVLDLGQAIQSPIGSQLEWSIADKSLQEVREFLDEGPVSDDAATRAQRLIQQAETAQEERTIAITLENVLIHSASHPEAESWKRMDRQLKQLLAEQGIDLDADEPMVVAKKIREHVFAERFSDILELWIGTRAQLGFSPQQLEPWTKAIFAADKDPLRSGIRKLLYAGKPPKREQLEALTKDVDLSKVSARTISWLASIYSFGGLKKEADEIVRNALLQHPTDVMLNFDCGYGYAGQGRWQEAIRMYSRAIALRNDVSGIWQMMGMALEQVEELENARIAYARACKLEDDYIPTWIRLGDVCLKLDDVDAALQAGRQAIQLDADRADGYRVAGRALMKQKKFSEALTYLKDYRKRCDEPQRDQADQWIRECEQGDK